MGKAVKLETMRATAPETVDSYLRYKGNRKKSKTDGFILVDFLRRVFEHNTLTQKEQRLTDEQILELVASEFEDDSYRQKKRMVTVWRNMFNTGRLHVNASYKPTFIAFRVNANKEFTKSTSGHKPLSIDQLKTEYALKNLSVPKELYDEVANYSAE